jgi:hypothetical protein
MAHQRGLRMGGKPSSVERRLATIFAADVEGHSRFMGREEGSPRIAVGSSTGLVKGFW